jgi:tRNA-5-taurinomethyluridine 2-sulfurtransferase
MKIAVLLSGGVDSSVALKLLKTEGHDITAFYLKIWMEDDVFSTAECPWEEDIRVANKICEKEKIPLEVMPLQREYLDRIVSYTINEVKNGRTPNPDVLCNERIKYGAFLEIIDSSYEKIASGHYAGVEEKDGKFYLLRNPDPIKDQTYFLSSLKQDQLKRAIYPLAKYNKEQVRKIAKGFNLPNQNRKDSQGLCFLGKIKFREFINSHLGEKKGDIINFDTGQKIGEHGGFYYYTIGQRHGLDLSGGPWYVVKKDGKNNIIYISNQENYLKIARCSFKVDNFNWIPEMPHLENIKVKIRHGENLYQAKINFTSKNSALIEIDSPDQGIASGQFAVFYNDKYCLGSAIISDI